MQIYHSRVCALKSSRACVRPDVNDAIAFDRNRFSLPQFLVYGVDVSIDENQIGGDNFGGGGREAAQQNAEDDEQGFHALPLLNPG